MGQRTISDLISDYNDVVSELKYHIKKGLRIKAHQPSLSFMSSYLRELTLYKIEEAEMVETIIKKEKIL